MQSLPAERLHPYRGTLSSTSCYAEEEEHMDFEVIHPELAASEAKLRQALREKVAWYRGVLFAQVTKELTGFEEDKA